MPQDRHAEGLCCSTRRCGRTPPSATRPSRPFSKGWWIDREGARERTEEIREEFDVKTPSVDVAAHALSGGNQQKLIIGREMTADPNVLIAAHPTRGIDVGAQAAVWQIDPRRPRRRAWRRC